jgi:ABC-2 type transport system ATP-binding protein
LLEYHFGHRERFLQPMSRAAISLLSLTKTFPAGSLLKSLLKTSSEDGGAKVLRGVSLEVYEGEVLGLLGPNGAGKTTLLEILSTLLLPTSGNAMVCGFDVVEEADKVRKLISYCPSTWENFYPRLTGVANLEFFALLNNLPRQEVREKIKGVLHLVGMDGRSDGTFQRYSEGMKQRLALARALLTDPRVLLLDEPTKSLDPLWQGEIRRLLRETVVGNLGKTVLLVTHSLAEAEQVCNRLAILHRGQIVALGTPPEVSAACGGADLTRAFQNAVTSEKL